jgi:hypothetical protein
MIYAREDAQLALAILAGALPGTLVDPAAGNNSCLIEPDPERPGTASTPPELAASIAAANPSLPGYRASDAAFHAANPLRITVTRMLMAAGPRRTTPDLRPQ